MGIIFRKELPMPKFFTDLKNADPVHEWVSEKILERRVLDTGYIVKLRAWYWNESMEDSPIFNEILEAPEIDYFIWDNDWYEGQENVAVYAIYGLNDLDLQDNIKED